MTKGPHGEKSRAKKRTENVEKREPNKYENREFEASCSMKQLLDKEEFMFPKSSSPAFVVKIHVYPGLLPGCYQTGNPSLLNSFFPWPPICPLGFRSSQRIILKKVFCFYKFHPILILSSVKTGSTFKWNWILYHNIISLYLTQISAFIAPRQIPHSQKVYLMCGTFLNSMSFSGLPYPSFLPRCLTIIRVFQWK